MLPRSKTGAIPRFEADDGRDYVLRLDADPDCPAAELVAAVLLRGE